MKNSKLLKYAENLRDRLDKLSFSGKIKSVYNPLGYAWKPFELYLEKYASLPKRVIFLGMNPGPWGMAQTGIPFGEINAVRDWLKITAVVDRPAGEISARPITGFDCTRSEVSGRRVWGLMREKFGTPESFFKDHFIANYCPLLFFDGTGKNVTPDKLLKTDREQLFTLCDTRIIGLIDVLTPRFLIGFGRFATERLESIHSRLREDQQENTRVVGLLHPSPANPKANKGWGPQTERTLTEEGVW